MSAHQRTLALIESFYDAARDEAQALHSDGDGFTFSPDGIGLASRRDHEKLRHLIAPAMSPISSPGLSAGGAMRAARVLAVFMPRVIGLCPYICAAIWAGSNYPGRSISSRAQP